MLGERKLVSSGNMEGDGLDVCRDRGALRLWCGYPAWRRDRLSGTVGTGCFLELNGTGLLQDPNHPVQWFAGRRPGRHGDHRSWQTEQHHPEAVHGLLAACDQEAGRRRPEDVIIMANEQDLRDSSPNGASNSEAERIRS